VVVRYRENGEEQTRERPRSITAVHRELEQMRAILNFARREGWIVRNPFEQGAPLISKADEEERLLAACTEKREHLRPLLVCLLDTGCRRGEMLQLRWGDIDFENQVINIRSQTTKTQRCRQVPISSRMRAELEGLYKTAKSDDELVFGIKTDVKRSFTAARKAAGVEDFHLHDARHTAITRMIERGVPPMQAMKISGHTTLAAFRRYLNVSDDALDRARQAMDDFQMAEEARTVKSASKRT